MNIKKKTSKKVRKSLSLINKIQKIRSKNNKNWMDLVKLSLKLDFKNTSKILSGIYKNDNEIVNITKEISRLK
mgnify:CR=1 FL=1